MAKVAIVTSGHFSTSPRVWKEADALAAHGHDVTVIGASYNARDAALDAEMLVGRRWRHRISANLVGTSLPVQAWRLVNRATSRVGRALLRYGVRSPSALGYAATSLLTAAREEHADLTILHLEPALWAGVQLLAEGYRVAVDVEDWHSENDAGCDWGGDAQKQFLSSLERAVLPRAAFVTTTSNAMAAALAAAYGCATPHTIYNAVAVRPSTPPPATDAVRFVWFSQTLGAGRGLEDLCAAMPLLTGEWEVEIRARASEAAVSWMRGLVPADLWPRVHIECVVPPDQLSAAVARHDVGLALESPRFQSKDLTASNKIFEYLQNGLFVVASATAGQREVLGLLTGGGATYRSGDAAGLASVLNDCIARRDALRAGRERLHREANAVLAYEHQAERLVTVVERALQAR